MKLLRKFLISITAISLVVILFLIIKQKNLETKINIIEENLNQTKEAIFPQPTIITKNGLPDSHLIKTTFIPQAPEKNWSQPWQDACEEASLLTLKYYYDQKNPPIEEIVNDIIKMIDYEEKQGWGISINTDQMSQLSTEHLNFKPKVIENPTLEEIKDYLSKDIPIIVPANGKTLYKENKFFSNGGPEYHNLVLLGYNDQKKQFTVHDVGTQHGAYFHYSYDLLMKSIHDFPDTNKKEDIDIGPKKILILIK